MSQRISLTRIIAINWYGFRQIFAVDENVLISGAFGTGKSAILDLVQYVLLGERWRANRAAAGNARGRDLVGYCLGDTNQTRNGNRHFLRQNGVTFIALEFTRPRESKQKEPVRETWGIRLQYSSPDASPAHTYFCIPERVEFETIAPGGKLLADDAFRSWIRREFGNDCLFNRQRDYIEEMAAPRHLNFDTAAFQRTFPKAIAFELEDNVEKFIREFILEESPLDVREVRAALRAYDDTRRRLEKQEDEAVFLRRICEAHVRHETSRREEAILNHVHQALKLRKDEQRHEKAMEELRRLKEEHADDLKKLAEAEAERARISGLLGEVQFEIQKDPDGDKIRRLEEEKRKLEAEVSSLEEARKSVRQRLDDRHYRWLQWLKHGAAIPLEGLKDRLVVDDALLSKLRTGSDVERLESLGKLGAVFNQIWRSVQELVAPVDAEIKAAQGKLQQLAGDLDLLSKGRAPGSFPLFNAIRNKLGDDAEQLARLIEVKPEAERWWPALELFLGRHRWTVVVNDNKAYRAALEILQKVPPGREGESLLNPSEVVQSRASMGGETLFSKVEVANPVARRYVENLLGDVRCVETIEQLESVEAGRAITPEGVFKQVPLRRRLKPAAAVELTLGREGIERMRSAKQKEQDDVREHLKALTRKTEDVRTWLDNGQKGELGNTTLPDRASELPTLPELKAKLDGIRQTIELLMTPEREERQNRYADFQQKQREITEKIGGLKTSGETFEIRARPLDEDIKSSASEIESAKIAVTGSRIVLGSSFSGILDEEIDARIEGVLAQTAKWPDRFEAVSQAAAKAGQSAVEALAERNNQRTLLATSRDEKGNLRHPEYHGEFAIEDPGNEPWSARLNTLETVELEKSRQLAVDRKSEWERRLEDNVLNELNRRITDATNTVRLLDRHMSQPVGKYRYRISQRKDTAGYGPIWALLSTGLEPTDPLAAAIHDGEVQRAKEELMRAVDSPDNADDRARRLLDYRNYHHYDIEMFPADREDAPPISLGRSGRNLSGGESQVPFFISMLAAFRRVYDRGDRASLRSQQLGLVVMDEAFSKLSGDGIDDCLALARRFDLQLVMAFPPERLGVMVPHAQTVVMCQKQIERDRDGYVTKITNVPMLTTMAEAMDALA